MKKMKKMNKVVINGTFKSESVVIKFFRARWFRGVPIYLRNLGVLLSVFFAFDVRAGFLEMPDTSQVPEFERESLLKDMDIPSVRERDPNPEAGPRLNVTEFRVQGLVEYPELGITREKIIKQVESIRFDMMGEGKQLDSGYTLSELKEVSDLIAQIEKETEGRHVGTVEVQRLVFLIREQRRQRGITLGMIETVADTITRYYRERGFILAKAYIPKQHVRDGVVTITLLLGELGEVNIQNNKRYSNSLLKRVFTPSIAKPVTNDSVEQGLYLLNDLPGLSVNGYFEPGAQVGDTKLNVNVNSESWYDANIRVDNHGSERSGEYRAYADFYLHNPLTIGDQIQLGVLSSFSPNNSTYGSFRYSLPLYAPSLRLSIGASTNDFAIGAGNSENSQANSQATKVEIEGKSFVTDANVEYKLRRSRVENHSIGLSVSQVESDIIINGGDSGLDDLVQNAEIYYEFDFLNEKRKTLNQGRIGIISSQFVDGAEIGQAQSPTVLSIDYSRLSFLHVPLVANEAKWIVRSGLQYSGKAVASVLQYGIAGPTKARGFAVNEFYGDDALYVSTDLVFKGPSFSGATINGGRVDELFQPFVFIDVAYGTSRAYDLGDADENVFLSDAGVGIKINFKQSVIGSFSIAQRISSRRSFAGTVGIDDGDETQESLVDKTPGGDARMYFDLQVSF